MANRLEGIKVAAIMTDGVEQVEFTSPRDTLKQEGAEVHLIAPSDTQEQGKVQAFQHLSPGDKFDIDLTIEDADPSDYDALLLPGGVANPDQLRVMEPVLDFVRQINDDDKPIFVICHGPWTLISAGLVRGRRMTSYHTIKDDMINAGAMWVDEPLVEDENIISSRKPDDLNEFNQAIIERLTQVKAEAGIA